MIREGEESKCRDELAPPDTRVAVPDTEGSFQVFDIRERDFKSYVASICEIVGSALSAGGVPSPLIAMREVLENLVHAVPCSASVVLNPVFSCISVCDTGPGMERTDIAFELGFSTADSRHRGIIRGVGIGLNIALEELRSLGGDLLLDSTPGRGTFVRLVISHQPSTRTLSHASLDLSTRQNNILFLLSEGMLMGPSQISSELNIGVGTAHRDLVRLQELGLVEVNKNGKRFLSAAGKSYLQRLLSL
ncbi:MAG: ATP-binding protein [Candidatus Bathyarchaeia archaeon]